jgi:hypothetical protein
LLARKGQKTLNLWPQQIQYLLEHLRLVDVLSIVFISILLLAFTPFVYSNAVKKLKIANPTSKFAVAFILGIIIIGILFLLNISVPK